MCCVMLVCSYGSWTIQNRQLEVLSLFSIEINDIIYCSLSHSAGQCKAYEGSNLES